jgi:hypothetical protein
LLVSPSSTTWVFGAGAGTGISNGGEGIWTQRPVLDVVGCAEQLANSPKNAMKPNLITKLCFFIKIAFRI